MKHLLAILLSVTLIAGCGSGDPQLTTAEISEFLEGNTASFGSTNADYHDGQGTVTFVSDGRYGSAAYVIADNQICYTYANNPDPTCLAASHTRNSRIKRFTRFSDGTVFTATLVGPGNQLSDFE